MGKLAVLLTAGTGTTVVSVGGFYLVQNSGTGVAQLDTLKGGEDAGKASASKELKFNSLQDFRDKRAYKCSSVEDMFTDSLDLVSFTNSNELSKTSPNATDYFGTPSDSIDKIKSCLIINWEKKTYIGEVEEDGSGNKWSGTFTWTWSFINNNKGFIVVNIATTSSGQLDLTGGAYFLEKQGDSDWKIQYHKEVKSNENKKITNSVFEEKFPKVKADSGVSVGDGNFWGFVSGNSDLEGMCGGSDVCPTNVKETKKEFEKFEWTFNKNDGKKISEWTENWKWWEEMYGPDGFNLQTGLEKFKGTWSKVGG